MDNTFDLFEDDGETTDYQRGKYAITRFSLNEDVFTIHPAQGDHSVIPAQRTYHVYLGGMNENNRIESFTITPAETHIIIIPTTKFLRSTL